MSRALRPAHAAHDGDVVFGAATGRAGRTADIYTLTDLGAAAADCLARAIARAVFEATPLPFSGALPSWRMKFGAVMIHQTRPRRRLRPIAATAVATTTVATSPAPCNR